MDCNDCYTQAKIDINQNGNISADRIIAKGDISGKDLEIEATTKIKVYAKILVNNLKINTRNIFVSTWGIVDGINKLFLGADRILNLGRITAVKTEIEAKHVLSIFGGTIRGAEILKINAVTNIVAFGGVLRGTTVVLLNGIYLNFIGLVRAFHLIEDTLIPCDVGVTVPEIPNDIRNITSMTKFYAIARVMLKNISNPLGTLLKVLFKIYGFVRNAREVYARYKNYKPDFTYTGTRKSALNILNGLLNLRSMLFCGRSVFDEKDFIINSTKFSKETIHENPFINLSVPSAHDVCTGIAKEIPSLFAPFVVIDGLVSARYGITVTGAVMTDALVTSENCLYQYELKTKAKPKSSGSVPKLVTIAEEDENGAELDKTLQESDLHVPRASVARRMQENRINS